MHLLMKKYEEAREKLRQAIFNGHHDEITLASLEEDRALKEWTASMSAPRAESKAEWSAKLGMAVTP
jgi:hypothetical protein